MPLASRAEGIKFFILMPIFEVYTPNEFVVSIKMPKGIWPRDRVHPPLQTVAGHRPQSCSPWVDSLHAVSHPLSLMNQIYIEAK